MNVEESAAFERSTKYLQQMTDDPRTMAAYVEAKSRGDCDVVVLLIDRGDGDPFWNGTTRTRFVAVWRESAARNMSSATSAILDIERQSAVEKRATSGFPLVLGYDAFWLVAVHPDGEDMVMSAIVVCVGLGPLAKRGTA